MSKMEYFIKKHSPMILTVIGASGVVATSVLAVKATPKAEKLLAEAKEEKGEDLTVLETVQVAWKPYIPAAVAGISTIFCIFGANHLNSKIQASLISAYTLLDTSYKEYRNKVNELYGEDADINVKNEIVKSKYDEDIIAEEDKELFFEPISMQFFESTMDEVLTAESMFMEKYESLGCASVNDYLKLLNLQCRPELGQLGWCSLASNDVYGYPDLEFDYEEVEMTNGQKCWNIITTFEPTEGYYY